MGRVHPVLDGGCDMMPSGGSIQSGGPWTGIFVMQQYEGYVLAELQADSAAFARVSSRVSLAPVTIPPLGNIRVDFANMVGAVQNHPYFTIAPMNASRTFTYDLSGWRELDCGLSGETGLFRAARLRT